MKVRRTRFSLSKELKIEKRKEEPTATKVRRIGTEHKIAEKRKSL